jgi:hypothetical protein
VKAFEDQRRKITAVCLRGFCDDLEILLRVLAIVANGSDCPSLEKGDALLIGADLPGILALAGWPRADTDQIPGAS